MSAEPRYCHKCKAWHSPTDAGWQAGCVSELSPAHGSALTPLQIENWKNLYPWMCGLSDFEIGQLRDMLQKKVDVDSQAPNKKVSDAPDSAAPNRE